MNTAERREAILGILRQGSEPVSASELARRMKVSRQVVVSDVALLRAAGQDISATPRGYVLEGSGAPETGIRFTVACRHDTLSMAGELYTVVDNGGGLLDVTVEHSIYGQITAPLRIFSRYDADEFMKKIASLRAKPLSDLTGGIHLHTISCKDEAAAERIRQALAEKGFLLDK